MITADELLSWRGELVCGLSSTLGFENVTAGDWVFLLPSLP